MAIQLCEILALCRRPVIKGDTKQKWLKSSFKILIVLSVEIRNDPPPLGLDQLSFKFLCRYLSMYSLHCKTASKLGQKLAKTHTTNYSVFKSEHSMDRCPQHFPEKADIFILTKWANHLNVVVIEGKTQRNVPRLIFFQKIYRKQSYYYFF